MTTAVATRQEPIDAALIERVLIHGDLRQLTPAQKVSYYKSVCESVGLNPLTQPFQYLVLNGKEILYATRAATEQLRQVHTVSVQIMAREVVEDCYIVTARATLPNGRQDENIGAVPIAGLKGESRANAMMKAETKAKRRVTLAICGLGMLDETEVASIDQKTSYSIEPPAMVVDVKSGQEVPASKKPEPPEGYAYLEGPQRQANGWFAVGWKGAEFRTKLESVIAVAEQAYQNGVPVKVHSKKTPWLDRVETWKSNAEEDNTPFPENEAF